MRSPLLLVHTTPGKNADVSRIGGWVGQREIWTFWRRKNSCPCQERTPIFPTQSGKHIYYTTQTLKSHIRIILGFRNHNSILYLNLGTQFSHQTCFYFVLGSNIPVSLLISPTHYRFQLYLHSSIFIL